MERIKTRLTLTFDVVQQSPDQPGGDFTQMSADEVLKAMYRLFKQSRGQIIDWGENIDYLWGKKDGSDNFVPLDTMLTIEVVDINLEKEQE